MSQQGRTSLEIVLRYHRAWTGGDVDGAVALLAADFVCHGAAGSFGKEEYRHYLANFVPKLVGIEDIAALHEDEHAVLIYYPQTAVTSTTPAAEYFTVRDGCIHEIILMFDRLAYAPPAEH